MTPRDTQTKPRAHGDVLTAISDGMVALLKEFYGRGPTRTKSYYEDDLVACVLRGGFTRVEQTLLETLARALLEHETLDEIDAYAAAQMPTPGDSPPSV